MNLMVLGHNSYNLSITSTVRFYVKVKTFIVDNLELKKKNLFYCGVHFNLVVYKTHKKCSLCERLRVGYLFYVF